MGSYSPRHLKREPKILNKVGRRGIAAVAAGAVVVPLAGMETASAAPSTGLAAAGPVAAVSHAAAAGQLAGVSQLATSVRIGPTVRYGSRGYAVKVVQRKLGGLAVDGIFGPRTNSKVKSFQRAHHLVVDGIVGRHTWTALGGYPGSAPAPTQSSSRIVSIAMSLRGVPYVYGGTTTRGFDCSGFTQYVFRRAGITLPRTASAQAAHVRHVSPSSRRPGDLMFWGYPAYHVGIYVGNGKMIAARHPGTVVGIQNVWGSPYYGRA